MGTKFQGGFTIIELTIFLAISSLLLVVALVGTGATIRNMRFSDSVRSFHSHTQKQFDEIINGVNSRSNQEVCANSTVSIPGGPGENPGASRCLLLGKMLKFTQDSKDVQVYQIVGSEPANVDFDNTTDEDLILQYNPTVVRTFQNQTYSIPWGATVSGMKRKIDSQGVDTYALIRSPRSSRIVSYTFTDDGSNALSAKLQGANSEGNATNICIKSADNLGRAAAVTVGAGQGQDSVTIQFDVDEPQECTP